ncbi:MAG: response regulator transcription factor [Flavobacteriales bacterium]|nr:response regulator transcription factor [Flavobacteriales bacterium]
MKTLLVDDHKLFLEGLELLLSTSNEIEVVGTALGGEEALRIMEDQDVDVLMTDLNMPEMDGRQLIQKVSQVYPDVRIIALTMISDGILIEKVLNAGADAYLLKNTDLQEILFAFQCISSGNQYLAKAVQQALEEFKTKHKTDELLTSRESDVLQCIVDGLSSKMIVDQLSISIDTVKFHRKNILSKLNQPNVAAPVRYVTQQGIV